MDQMRTLVSLFDDFRIRLEKCPAQKRAAALKKAISHLEALLKSLQPTQREIKQELLTDRTAMLIRETWNQHKKIFDLVEMAKELSLSVKRPTIDHIIIGYYFPENRLPQLAQRLEKIAEADPANRQKRVFQEWRGTLRSKTSPESVREDLSQLVKAQGIDSVRQFADYLGAKDVVGNRRLSKKAPVPRLLEALTIHLWREKMKSKVQEGA